MLMSDKEVEKDNEATESQGSAFLQNKLLSSRSIIISGEVNQILAVKSRHSASAFAKHQQ